MSRRTPLGRVLGLGSAKDGTEHFWMQRLSAVAMLPLGLWFVFGLAVLGGGGSLDYQTVGAWLASPVRSVAAALLVGTLAYHSQLGLQVVIEDYVHHEGLKLVSLVAVKLAHLALAVAGVFAILRIGLGS